MALPEKGGRELILASASPRRRSLLETLGVSFDCDPAQVDETPHPREVARRYVERMARAKAGEVRTRHPTDRAVLAADTAVVCGSRIFGKPSNRDDALSMLQCLSGRRHQVLTAVCVLAPDLEKLLTVSTAVAFVELCTATREAYLDSGEPWDKAGAYAIQGLGGAFVSSIRGSYSNVVGLPLAETWQLLREAGVVTRLDPQPAL